MVNSRDIGDLHVVVAGMCKAFVSECRREGIDAIITSTYRDHDSQNELYAIGRTKPGKIVTNARGGDSVHNYRMAFDFLVLRHGKPVWSTKGDGIDDNPADDDKDDLELWQRAGACAERVGLSWSGRWTGKLRELGHCQYTNGMTIEDLKAGRTLLV